MLRAMSICYYVGVDRWSDPECSPDDGRRKVDVVTIERRAYERLIEIAQHSDPSPRAGLVGGTDGVVRSIYLLGADDDRPERITLTSKQAAQLHEQVAMAGEYPMGHFMCARTLDERGRLQLPRMDSGWGRIIQGDAGFPWLGISVDTAPVVPSNWERHSPARITASIYHEPPSKELLEKPKAEIVIRDLPAATSKPLGEPTSLVSTAGTSAAIALPEDVQDAGLSVLSVELGRDAVTDLAVRLGLLERQQGTYIIGKPGTGKTTLIEHMVVQDIEHGLGVCVLDPHGDLIDAILTRIPADRESDVILLDAADTHFPFGLNLFECRDLSDRSLVGRVATQAVEVFEKLWGDTSWGPQLAQVLRNCAYTMSRTRATR